MPRAGRLCSWRDTESKKGCLRLAVENGRCRQHPFDNGLPAWYRPPGHTRRSVPVETARRIVLRDGGVCGICGCLAENGEIDHRIPVFRNGTDEDNNLWLLCQVCHKAKTASESATARRLAAERRRERHG